MRIIGLTLVVWLLANKRFSTYWAFATSKNANDPGATVKAATSGTGT